MTREVKLSIRGIGLDTTPGCFVHGGGSALHDNIAAFVNSRREGDLAVSMFPSGARVDFRPWEPHWSQVKIGACKEHRHNLDKLCDLIAKNGGKLTPDIVIRAQQ